jgi:hypothetical protein
MIKTESFIYFYLSQGVYFLMKTIKLQQQSKNLNIVKTKILIHVVNSQYIFLSEACFFYFCIKPASKKAGEDGN